MYDHFLSLYKNEVKYPGSKPCQLVLAKSFGARLCIVTTWQNYLKDRNSLVREKFEIYFEFSV